MKLSLNYSKVRISNTPVPNNQTPDVTIEPIGSPGNIPQQPVIKRGRMVNPPGQNRTPSQPLFPFLNKTNTPQPVPEPNQLLNQQPAPQYDQQKLQALKQKYPTLSPLFYQDEALIHPQQAPQQSSQQVTPLSQFQSQINY